MKFIVLLAAASIFTAASVDSLKCKTCYDNICGENVCKENEKCVYFSNGKFYIVYEFKFFYLIDESSGFSNINIKYNFVFM